MNAPFPLFFDASLDSFVVRGLRNITCEFGRGSSFRGRLGESALARSQRQGVENPSRLAQTADHASSQGIPDDVAAECAHEIVTVNYHPVTAFGMGTVESGRYELKNCTVVGFGNPP